MSHILRTLKYEAKEAIQRSYAAKNGPTATPDTKLVRDIDDAALLLRRQRVVINLLDWSQIILEDEARMLVRVPPSVPDERTAANRGAQEHEEAGARRGVLLLLDAFAECGFLGSCSLPPTHM